MKGQGIQDPVTEAVVATAGSHDLIPDPLVEMLLSGRPKDLAPDTDWPSEDAAADRHEKVQKSQQIEETLRVTQRENEELKQQIKQQFQDLGELEIIMDQLEAQVGGHEAIIKQQGRRIQEQEQTITQLNSRLQQFIQALVLNALKTRM